MNNFFGEENKSSEVEAFQEEASVDQEEVQESELSEEGEEITASEEEVQEDYTEDQEEQFNDDIEIKLKEKDAEIEKVKMDAQKWVSSLQSSFDKQLAEMQGQLRQFMESQNSVSSHQNDEESFLDEYGEERPLTASEVRRLMSSEEKKRQSVAEKERVELEKARHAEQEESNAWLQSQPDIQEVLDFYQKNLKNDPVLSQLNYQAQYFYVKNKMGEQGKKTFNKKPRKQKRITPTGNPNRNFSSRANVSANNLMSALEAKRQEYGKARGFFS